MHRWNYHLGHQLIVGNQGYLNSDYVDRSKGDDGDGGDGGDGSDSEVTNRLERGSSFPVDRS